MKVYIDKLQAQIAETDKKLYETNFDLTKAQEVLKIKVACLRVTSVIRTLWFCCGVFFEGAILLKIFVHGKPEFDEALQPYNHLRSICGINFVSNRLCAVLYQSFREH